MQGFSCVSFYLTTFYWHEWMFKPDMDKLSRVMKKMGWKHISIPKA